MVAQEEVVHIEYVNLAEEMGAREMIHDIVYDSVNSLDGLLGADPCYLVSVVDVGCVNGVLFVTLTAVNGDLGDELA